jgi:hypothetical protein
VAGEGTGGDGFEEGVDLLGFAAGEEFHTAIGEIGDCAGDFEFASEVFDGVAEADALDAAFVVDAEGFHGLTTERTEDTERGEEVFVLEMDFIGVCVLRARIRVPPKF